MPPPCLPSSPRSLCPRQMCLPSPERVWVGQILRKTPGPSSIPRAWRSSLKCIPVSTPRAALLPAPSSLARAWIFPASVSPLHRTTPLLPAQEYFKQTPPFPSEASQLWTPSGTSPSGLSLSANCTPFRMGHGPLPASVAAVTPWQPWVSQRPPKGEGPVCAWRTPAPRSLHTAPEDEAQVAVPSSPAPAADRRHSSRSRIHSDH